MKILRRRIATWIASRLVPEQRIEAEGVRRAPDGGVSAAYPFRSPKDAQRFQRFLTLQRHPLGRLAIQWLTRAGDRREAGGGA